MSRAKQGVSWGASAAVSSSTSQFNTPSVRSTRARSRSHRATEQQEDEREEEEQQSNDNNRENRQGNTDVREKKGKWICRCDLCGPVGLHWARSTVQRHRAAHRQRMAAVRLFQPPDEPPDVVDPDSDSAVAFE